MTLRELLATDGATIEAIASHLDALDHAARAEQTLALNKKEQIRLWDLAATSAPIGPEYFVPNDVPPMTPVVHHGLNTLPAFRRFAKVMAKDAADPTLIYGYNEGATRKVIGPGYFVLRPTAGNETWEERASQVVDYFTVPECEVPAHWPKVKPNSSGLQVLVYNKTRDFMRRVSEHVSIGSAYKVEKKIGGAYFVLCREPHDASA